MLAYFLKVNVALVLFYTFYRLFCLKDTFFGWRRGALMSFFVLALLAPLGNIEVWVQQQVPMVAIAELYADVLPKDVAHTGENTDWKHFVQTAILTIYWCGVAILMVRFLLQLASVIRLAGRCLSATITGCRVRLLPQGEAPFSFFHLIFVCPDIHHSDELNEILAHEQAHARQWHSLDVVVSELVCIGCWFNPFAWLLKDEVRTNLEYLADEHVLNAGHNNHSYQYHLLELSHHKAAANIYNNFNVLPLKKRIFMMNKKRSRKIGRAKYLMFLPLTAMLMVLSNIEVVARSMKESMQAVTNPQDKLPQSQQDTRRVLLTLTVLDMDKRPLEGVNILATTDRGSVVGFENKTDKSGRVTVDVPEGYLVLVQQVTEEYITNKYLRPEEWQGKENVTVVMNGERHPRGTQHYAQDSENPIFEVVENMPEFPDGGMAGLMQYLSKNINYPRSAVKAGLQGRVTVKFIVERDGSISNVSILRSISPELDKEAIRVVEEMPKWNPGTQRGKAVRVSYTIPVMFRLSGQQKEALSGHQDIPAGPQHTAPVMSSK